MSYEYSQTLGSLAQPIKIPSFGSFSSQQLLRGRNYLLNQGSYLANFSNKNLKTKEVTAKVVAGNKVKVDITSPWKDWNDNAAALIAPVKSTILSISILPSDFTKKIVSRPLDAIIDLFDPILDRVAKAEKRVLDKHLNGGKKVEFFGKYLDLRLSTDTDSRMDKSTLNITKKFRIIRNFFVLWWKKPLELTAECFQEGLNIAKDVAEIVGKAVNDGLIALGETVQAAAEGASNAAAGVLDAVGGFLGLSGEPLTTTAAATAAPVGATLFGVPLAIILDSIIAIVNAAIPLAVSAFTQTIKAPVPAPGAGSTKQDQTGQQQRTALPVVPLFVAGFAVFGALLYLSSRKA